MPAGLRESDRLPEPLFTPARKNDHGHDENLTPAEARAALGDARYEELRDLTLDLYTWAAAYAARRGILLADTKFEFGLEAATGRVLLADEILTPDSSRFWPADTYQPADPQPSFDKQYLRDYLKTLTTWNKTAPGPELPADGGAKHRRQIPRGAGAADGNDIGFHFIRPIGPLSHLRPIPPMKIGLFLPNATFDLPGTNEVGGIEVYALELGEALAEARA